MGLRLPQDVATRRLAITRDSSRGLLLVVKMTDLVVAAAGETSVEVALPEGRSCLQLCCSGGS